MMMAALVMHLFDAEAQKLFELIRITGTYQDPINEFFEQIAALFLGSSNLDQF